MFGLSFCWIFGNWLVLKVGSLLVLCWVLQFLVSLIVRLDSSRMVIRLVIVIRFIDMLVRFQMNGSEVSVLNIIIVSMIRWKINRFVRWLCLRNIRQFLVQKQLVMIEVKVKNRMIIVRKQWFQLLIWLVRVFCISMMFLFFCGLVSRMMVVEVVQISRVLMNMLVICMQFWDVGCGGQGVVEVVVLGVEFMFVLLENRLCLKLLRIVVLMLLVVVLCQLKVFFIIIVRMFGSLLRLNRMMFIVSSRQVIVMKGIVSLEKCVMECRLLKMINVVRIIMVMLLIQVGMLKVFCMVLVMVLVCIELKMKLKVMIRKIENRMFIQCVFRFFFMQQVGLLWNWFLLL